MAEQLRQCFQLPIMNNDDVLSVLRQLARDDWLAMSHADLRVQVGNDGRGRLVLPARPRSMPGGEEAVRNFRKRVFEALQTSGQVEQLGREHKQAFSIPFESLHAPLEAAVAITAQHHPHPEGVPTQLRNEDRQMVLVVGAEQDVPRIVADIGRLGRYVSGATHRQGDGRLVAVLLVNDAASAYGLVSTYEKPRELDASLYRLCRHSIGEDGLWLPLELQPDPERLGKLSAIVDAAKEGGSLSQDVQNIAYLDSAPPPNQVAIVYLGEDALPDRPDLLPEVSALTEPLQSIQICVMCFRPEKEAADELQSRILEMRHRMGYRVSLRSAARELALEMDVEALTEQIDDLTLQIQQIQALQAPQSRLMRFSDLQLPAMIDGLRRLPATKLTDGSLQYAAGHSAGRSEPVHYLLYDPSETFYRTAEARWQAITGDRRLMSYWLEPFVAMARFENPTTTKTEVYVPSEHFMVPSLAHFGGSVDDTLRVILGNLFDEIPELMQDPNRGVMYVFTPSESDPNALQVEVLDRVTFAPLHQQLHWINDYLEMQSPIAVSADRLAEVASALYEGRVASALVADVSDEVSRLDKEWEGFQRRIEADAASALDLIQSEMDAVAARMADLRKYLHRADREMDDLELLVRSAEAAVGQAQNVSATLEQQDHSMRRARDYFEHRCKAELKRAEERIRINQNRVGGLRNRMREIRDWGKR